MSQQQNLSSEQQQAILSQVRNEVQAAALQELLQKSTEKCFAICVPKPGSTLSSKEQTCLANCLDRYIDTMKAVSTTLMKSE